MKNLKERLLSVLAVQTPPSLILTEKCKKKKKEKEEKACWNNTGITSRSVTFSLAYAEDLDSLGPGGGDILPVKNAESRCSDVLGTLGQKCLPSCKHSQAIVQAFIIVRWRALWLFPAKLCSRRCETPLPTSASAPRGTLLCVCSFCTCNR